ncbi:MAG TPA: NAD(P)-binding domain-containing protein [Ktedonosporobacter sp.]|nr:NAD(P)-binding domain-containing protein [Ktedonosporobacter sp.]
MPSLRIAILGAGKVGGTLGRHWARAGHTVAFGVRNPTSEKAQGLLAEPGDRVTIGSIAEALPDSDVILLAVPGAVVDEIITTYANLLDHKIIIDAANKMQTTPANSVATLQAHAPNALIYRAFNSYGWENFADPIYQGTPADLFYSGPDGIPQAQVEQLISEVGLHPVRLGGVDQADLVDGILRLWFTIATAQKNRNIALKVLAR